MPDLKPKLAEQDILPSGPAAGLGVGMIALIIAALYVGRESLFRWRLPPS
jgi:hypothetical protein